MDAWLVFLSMDNPEMIVRLIETWPEFQPMYAGIYEMCRNIEGVMDMFSKELQELDRNTVRYMIDEMQETIDQQEAALQREKLLREKLAQQYPDVLKKLEESEKQGF